MGEKVTVDSDDLMLILAQTGVCKDMEKLIRRTANDPFVSKDDIKLQLAHDRLGAEVRRATRGDIHPDYNAPLSSRALALLSQLKRSGLHEIDHAMMALPNYRELTVKGMIEYGSKYTIIYWGNIKEQQRLNQKEVIVVRVTPRGEKLLNDKDTTNKAVN